MNRFLNDGNCILKENELEVTSNDLPGQRSLNDMSDLNFTFPVIQWTPLNKPASGRLNLGLISGGFLPCSAI